MGTAAKTRRRVAVMMMNSAQHMEIVEVQTLVRQTGTVDLPAFELIEQDAETEARRVMRDNRINADDYDYVCTLVANLHGMYPGRIVYGKTPDVTRKIEW